MTRRNITPEQQAKSDARREQFRALAQQIGSMSDAQRAEMAARMVGVVTIEGHVLSVHNACMVACQRPDATMLGGFQQWIKAGRCVRKGEHGLMIWAPARRADSRDSETPSNDKPRFIMVTVFDVSQTEIMQQTAVA